MPAPTLSAEQRLDIITTIADTARQIDLRAYDDWLTCWHPAAVLTTMANRVVTGHEELRKWAQDFFARRDESTQDTGLVHFSGIPVISGDTERAYAQSYATTMEYSAGNGVQVIYVLRYDDELVEAEDTGWVLYRRRITGVLGPPTGQ